MLYLNNYYTRLVALEIVLVSKGKLFFVETCSLYNIAATKN